MAQESENYGLILPEAGDYYAETVMAENMEVIDGLIYGLDAANADAKADPADGDGFAVVDSATEGTPTKRVLWSVIKAKLALIFAPIGLSDTVDDLSDAVDDIEDALENKADLGSDGKISADQLPEMDYDPAGSADDAYTQAVATAAEDATTKANAAYAAATTYTDGKIGDIGTLLDAINGEVI